MSIEENKALVLRFIEEVQNQHNLDALNEIYSPNIIDHSGKLSQPSVEAAKDFYTMLFAALPDFHFTVHEMVAEGDLVVTYKTMHATHMGVFLGIPPTGRQITFDVMDINAIHEGKITDHWAVDNSLRVLQQLGIIQEPG
jgi:steroid delta-isomerase-like uncharacterized protein